MTASRTSHSTSSNGCLPSFVKNRLNPSPEALASTSRSLVATPTSSYASLFELATDQPALALGGYQGWDRILTPDDLSRLVAAGTVRFFLLGANPTPAFGGFAGGAGGQDATADLAAWVRANCTAVPASQWQTSTAGNGGTAAGGSGGGVPTGGTTGGAPGVGTGARGPAGGGFGQSQQLYECSRAGS